MVGPDSFPKPTVGDWLLLGISLAFVGMGAAIVRTDRNVGIITLALFGLGACVFASIIVRKWRYRRSPPLQVSLVGGVPIRPLRSRLLLLALGLGGFSGVILVFGRSYGLLFWSMGWLIGGCSAWLLLRLATGRLPEGYIQFDPLGVTIARHQWACVVPWDAVSRLETAEWHDNPVLLIFLRDPAAVQAKPPQCQARCLRAMASNMRWIGAPLVIMTSQYGLDLPWLVQALERYRVEPEARIELAQHLLPVV